MCVVISESVLNDSKVKITAAVLMDRHRGIWDHDVLYPSLGLRTYRAIRWLAQAEREHSSRNVDVAFVAYWISFNATYASISETLSERGKLHRYFSKLISMDRGDRVANMVYDESLSLVVDRSSDIPQVREKLSGPVVSLIHNHFTFEPFWQHKHEIEGYADWEKHFESSKNKGLKALQRRDSRQLLTELFSRLYTIRNQLMHGGATTNSSKNRDTITDGANIMAFLVPIFIDIMMDSPEDDGWGETHYPPV